MTAVTYRPKPGTQAERLVTVLVGAAPCEMSTQALAAAIAVPVKQVCGLLGVSISHGLVRKTLVARGPGGGCVYALTPAGMRAYGLIPADEPSDGQQPQVIGRMGWWGGPDPDLFKADGLSSDEASARLLADYRARTADEFARQTATDDDGGPRA